jgi:SAM-dependent methyltransferase
MGMLQTTLRGALPLASAIFGLFGLGCANTPPSAAAAPPSHNTSGHHGAGGHHHGHGAGHHGQGPLVHRFEHAEQWATQFDDPARDAWQRPADVIAAMSLRPGMTVADLGAGTGYFEPWLSRAVGETGVVLALDVEPDMVRYLKERVAREHLGNVRPAVVPMGDPNLPADGVDRVLVVDTWHHIPERAAYAKKLRDGLKPGGQVFIVDFKLDASHGPPAKHRLSPEQVVQELTQGGLHATVSATKLPDQYIVEGTRP